MSCNLKFSMKEPQLRIFTLHKDNFTPPLSVCFIIFCRQVPLNNTKPLLANTLPSPNIRGFHQLPSVFHQLALILGAVLPKPTGSFLRSTYELQRQHWSDMDVIPTGPHFLTSVSQEFTM